MARLRYNNCYGSLGATQLAGDLTISLATPLTYNDGVPVPNVVAPNTLDITVDPETANFEIERITAYTQGTLTATVQRGVAGTAKIHTPPAVWGHDPSTTDFTYPKFKVTDYGAKVDGITDDTAAIVAAAADAAVSGGTVIFPAGTCLTTGVDIPSGVTFEGVGSIIYEGASYSTTLAPYSAGQDHVVRHQGQSGNLRRINIDGKGPSDTIHANYSLLINAGECSGSDIGVINGAIASIRGTSSAGGYMLDHFALHSNTETTTPVPFSFDANDFQLSQGLVNGQGFTINGTNGLINNLHIIGIAGNTKALVVESSGGNSWSNIYLDSPTTVACVDRSGAGMTSEWSNINVVQSIAAITGIPVFKDTTTATACVHIRGLRFASAFAAGSTFTYVVQHAAASTILRDVNIPQGLANWIIDAAVPKDSVSGIFIAGTNVPNNGKLATVKYGLDGTVYTTTSTTPVAVDSTNLKVSFVAPSSGQVVIRLTALTLISPQGDNLTWLLVTHGTTTSVATYGIVTQLASAAQESVVFTISGLTPGTTYTYDWAWEVSAGTATMWAGIDSAGGAPATIEVEAA